MVSADTDGWIVLTDLRISAALLSVCTEQVVQLYSDSDSLVAIHSELITTISRSESTVDKSQGRVLSTACTDGVRVISAWGVGLELWQLNTGHCIEKIVRDVVPAWSVSALQVSPTGKTCYLGTDRGQVFSV